MAAKKKKKQQVNSPNDLIKLVQAGLTGGIFAAIVNLLILFLANFSNGGPIQVMRPGAAVPMDLPFFMVTIFSVVPGVIAALLYFALKCYFFKRTPYVFFILATLVLILFAFPPLSSPSKIAVMALELMHLAAAVIILYFILGAASPVNLKKGKA